MREQLQLYQKATTLLEVDNAIRFDVPIHAQHPFFTDFSDVRGDFEDRMVYKTLNIHPKTFVYNWQVNQHNKVVLFLAGMRGSGKTTELTKIVGKLHNPQGFFCVTCNLDDGLDINDIEYMDILIFQLERLFEDLQAYKVKVNQDVLVSLQNWFAARVKEVNKSIKKEGGFEMEIKAETPSLLSFLGIAAKLKANLQGSKETAEKIRTAFRNNFSDFAKKFNEFVEHVNMVLRGKGLARELLFVIDGLEKIATRDIRRKIVLDETNRIRQIKVNTIFTLPIELTPARRNLESFSTVVSFPFVKIREQNGKWVEKAIQRFEEFVYRRIDASLFDSPETVRKAIIYGGGSPRELLRILEYANMYADEDSNKILASDLERGIRKLASEAAQYISEEDCKKLKKLKTANEKGLPVPFDEDLWNLIEKLIVFEYNDGTFKRVNPIVEASQLYQQYVG